MSQLSLRPLTIALVLGLGVLTLTPLAQAQSSGHQTRAERRAARQQGQASAETEARPPAYPNATRQAPDAKATPRLMPKLKAMQERGERLVVLDGRTPEEHRRQCLPGLSVAVQLIAIRADARRFDQLSC